MHSGLVPLAHKSTGHRLALTTRMRTVGLFEFRANAPFGNCSHYNADAVRAEPHSSASRTFPHSI